MLNRWFLKEHGDDGNRNTTNVQSAVQLCDDKLFIIIQHLMMSKKKIFSKTFSIYIYSITEDSYLYNNCESWDIIQVE